MTDNSDSPSSVLGAELARALERSYEISLNSLVSLRKAVRSYTIHHRNLGTPLDVVTRSAARVLLEAEDGRATDGNGARDGDGARDLDLARHLALWCKEDYKA